MSLKTNLKKYGHIFIALSIALAAGLLIYYYVNVNAPSQKVIVTATRLPVGATITSDAVKYDVYPKAKLPADALTRPEDVIDKTVTVGMLEDTVVRKANLTEGKGGLSVRLATLAPGRVAVDLPPDTALGLIGMAIGDQVDLFSEVGIVDAGGKSVANDVGPVAKGAILIGTPNNKNDKQPGPVEKGTYVVAVKPEEQKPLADSAVRGKKFTVFLLPTKGGQQ